jgi:hypothetical protein
MVYVLNSEGRQHGRENAQTCLVGPDTLKVCRLIYG